MRPLEITLALAATVLCSVFWMRRRTGAQLPLWAKALPGLAVLLALVYVWQEGYRWQMLPLLALIALFVGMELRRAMNPPIRQPALGRPMQLLRRFLVGLSLLALSIAIALPIILPVPNLPVPTGPYTVGTTSMPLRDEHRMDALASKANRPRDLMIQIWYPATPEPGIAPAPWLPNAGAAGRAIASKLNFPSFLLDHVGLVRSNSVADAPRSRAEVVYPVIIYSHGWTGFRQINANQSENLASHGYVVVAVDHTFGALFTQFNDGRVFFNDPSLLPKRSQPNFLSAAQLLEEVFAQDVSFVLDELEKLNAVDKRFAAMFDLNRVGIFGHSTGGGAIIKTCARDQRCKAGLGQDAWVEPVPDEVIALGVPQPFLFLRSAQWANGDINNQRNENRLARLIHNTEALTNRKLPRITIQNSKHYDFVLIPLLSPLGPALGLRGTIAPHRLMPLIDEVMLAFFDAQLKGQPDRLPRVLARYPEAVLENK